MAGFKDQGTVFLYKTCPVSHHVLAFLIWGHGLIWCLVWQVTFSEHLCPVNWSDAHAACVWLNGRGPQLCPRLAYPLRHWWRDLFLDCPLKRAVLRKAGRKPPPKAMLFTKAKVDTSYPMIVSIASPLPRLVLSHVTGVWGWLITCWLWESEFSFPKPRFPLCNVKRVNVSTSLETLVKN